MQLPLPIHRAPTLLYEATTEDTPTVMLTCPSWASTISQVSDRSFAGRSTEDGMSEDGDYYDDDDWGSSASMEERVERELEGMDLGDDLDYGGQRGTDLSEASTGRRSSEPFLSAEGPDVRPHMIRVTKPELQRRPSRELPFTPKRGAIGGSPRIGLVGENAPPAPAPPLPVSRPAASADCGSVSKLPPPRPCETNESS
jgi:hypothetical protein